MESSAQITLKYEGPDVDDGSMSISDFVPVVQGFASAYGKLANAKGIRSQHNLRVVGISKGSANILLKVWELLGENSGQFESIEVIGSSALSIVAIIRDLYI